jgi:hypothetical protein
MLKLTKVHGVMIKILGFPHMNMKKQDIFGLLYFKKNWGHSFTCLLSLYVYVASFCILFMFELLNIDRVMILSIFVSFLLYKFKSIIPLKRRKHVL